MNIVSRFIVFASAFGSLATFSAVTFAHVDLSSPNPRAHGETEGDLKSGPCGQTTNGRTGNVNVFAPAETITVTWNEYIDHPAYYRIAFDDDGDDGFVMRTDGQTDEAADDPQAVEASLNMDAEILAIITEDNDTTVGTSTDIRTASVTLPNITCENCTLQLIQYMYNNPGQGYFQCADIALRAAAGSGETPAAADADIGGDDAGSTNVGAAGAAGVANGAAGSSSGGTGNASSNAAPPSGGNGGTSGAPPGAGGMVVTGGSAPVAVDGDDDGGCTISTHANEDASEGLFSLLALGLGLATRRRR